MGRTTSAAATIAALALAAGLAAPAAAATSAEPGDLDWFFTRALGGTGTTSFPDFGNALDGDFPLVCDVTGEGDEPGLWSFGRFYLGDGAVDVSFGRSDGSDYPICGDWDGDGIDTPGVVRGNRFILARSNVDGGGGTTSFAFGRSDDFLVVGDWDGDGDDTVAVVRGNQYIAATANVDGGGGVKVSSWGAPTDFPVAGDWDGDGDDTIALQRGNTFFVSNGSIGTRLAADRTFGYGRAGDHPVAGTLAPDTRASIGLVRES